LINLSDKYTTILASVEEVAKKLGEKCNLST